jgi:putative peptidoglycan lipid II flippase
LLYQRGEFTQRSTELVAWALLWYAAGLVGHSILEVLARAFYALHDTKTPVIVGVIAMSLNVVFSFWFAAVFKNIGWMPHGGLALANSLATALETIGLLILMRRRLNGIKGMRILLGVGQASLGAGAMSLALWVWINQMSGQSIWIFGFGGIIIGGVVYGLTMLLLRVDEVRQVLRAATTRLGIS